jgi:DNA-binding transcriptional LysR family regulator
MGGIVSLYDREELVELAQLRYFQAIAEHGSLTAAAKALRVSQPTLTVAMKNLEEQLGTKLIHRGRDGVTLTRTGLELRGHAAQIVNMADYAEKRIVGLESDDEGKFVVGCHESLGAYFLPAFMRGFLQAAPRIEVSLMNASSAAVLDAVVARDIDFGLVVNPLKHDDLILSPLFHDAVDVFVARASLEGGRPLCLEAARARLCEGLLIFAGRVSQSNQLIDLLAEQELVPTRRLSCGDLELVKSLALEGVGVALLPRRVAAYGQEGRLVRLHPDLPNIPDVISLVYRADFHKTRAAVRLKEALVAHGKKLDLEEPARPLDAGLAPAAETGYR